jgi:AAA ATPase domain
VFGRFIAVFAREEHPLALFLDDLQWLDAATLDLLEHLVTHSEVQHLLLVGAYRDNEVGPSHPLLRTLDAIRTAGAFVKEVSLAPLAREDLGRLIVDTLSCTPDHAAPLARLVHEKTGGNPFFAIQFISALAEEGLLRFDHDAAGWHWELDRVYAKGYTDNVMDLMVGLSRLPLLARSLGLLFRQPGENRRERLVDFDLHVARRARFGLCCSIDWSVHRGDRDPSENTKTSDRVAVTNRYRIRLAYAQRGPLGKMPIDMWDGH